MTLEEAIRINKNRDTEEDEGNDEDNYKANQLGIEALRLNLSMRETYAHPELLILPSETKE